MESIKKSKSVELVGKYLRITLKVATGKLKILLQSLLSRNTSYNNELHEFK